MKDQDKNLKEQLNEEEKCKLCEKKKKKQSNDSKGDPKSQKKNEGTD